MLDQLLTNILRETNNTATALDAIGKAIAGSDQTISLKMVDAAGNETEYEIPSMGYLLHKLEKIEADVKAISSGDERTVFVRNSDGTYRRIVKQSVPHEPTVPSNISIPSNFTFKSNKQVYDNLVDPLMAVSVDMGSAVTDSTRRFLVKKITVDAQTQADKDVFASIFNGRNDIDHNTVYDSMKASSLDYYESVEEIQLELKVLDGGGNFSVTSISEVKTTEQLGDETIQVSTYFYTLDTLDYEDNISKGSFKSLKVGDSLMVNSSTNSTRYEVLTVNSSTNQISVKRTEGFDVIGKGTDVLAYSGKFVQNTRLNIPIGYDERAMFFFKSIDEGYGHASGSWSAGMGIYSNELVMPTTGGTISMASFYKDYVSDVGRIVREIADERKVPLEQATTPDVVVLNVNDFKVLEINSHKRDNSITNNILKKNKEKVSIKSQLASVDRDIKIKKQEIATKVFRNSSEKVIEENNLQTMRRKREDLAIRQESIVEELTADLTGARTYTPKYRVRGFWSIPSTKYLDEVNEIGPQDVIGFIIQYRYLSESGEPEPVQNLQYTESGETKNGSFTRWAELRSPIRKKVVDSQGQLIWKTEKPQDGDTININQIDIPITKGEQVEIRVKSISEVGYPLNPLESAWSEPVTISFPEDLGETNPIADIEKVQQEDSLNQKFKKELVAMGLDGHTDDSVQVGDLLFTHQAESIATSEKTPENRPKSVNDLFIEHKARIAALEALISGASGEMEITILDDAGNEIQKVTNSQTVKLFAGYYVDEIANASVKKGEIVNKLYYIQISNLSDADLELLSYVPGSYLEAVPDNTYTGFVIDQNQFNNYRQYWKVPTSLRKYINNQELFNHHNDNTDPFINTPIFASRQSKGQFVYSRYTDISLNTSLYGKPASVTDEAFLPIQTGSTPTAYVWNYLGAATGNGNLTEFCVHIEHPDIQAGADLITNLSTLFAANGGLPNTNLGGSTVYYPYFVHSAYFNLQENEANGLIQLEYVQHQKSGGVPTLAEFPRKLHFAENDKYLIGSNTCGSYLSILPEDHDLISIDGTLYNNTEVVKKDANIRIPVLFSYRMTDYDGSGSSGDGVIGGHGSSATNLRYRKKIGIDVQQFDKRLFSFDIEVFAQYKKEGTLGI